MDWRLPLYFGTFHAYRSHRHTADGGIAICVTDGKAGPVVTACACLCILLTIGLTIGWRVSMADEFDALAAASSDVTLVRGMTYAVWWAPIAAAGLALRGAGTVGCAVSQDND